MGENFNARIEILRKQSRTLLVCIEKNSKKLKKDIQTLKQQNIGSTKSSNNLRRCSNTQVTRTFNSWKRRNDSSGVNAALCPDYIYNCPKLASVSASNMACKKLITSQKCSEDLCTSFCNKVLYRKPVKGCYCSSEVSKIKHQLPRTQQKCSYWCDQCKGSSISIPDAAPKCIRTEIQSPSMSSETLRRIQKIDYTPRSQFLRNVQSKVSVLQPAALDNHYEKSPWPSALNLEQDDEDISENQSKIISNKRSRSTNQLSTFNSSLSVPLKSEIGEENTYNKKCPIRKINKGVQVQPESLNRKFVNKKVNTTKKKASDEDRTTESSMIEKDFCKYGDVNTYCHCYCRHKIKRLSKKLNSYKLKENHIGSKPCPKCCWHETRQDEDGNELENCFEKGEQDVRDLRKFRDQNYFDTHGSTQTLLSCRSSGSLRQFCMNDNIFSEPVRRVHRRNPATTMLPWATVQRKRVHYFPKYVVPQEKTLFNTNYKKRRCQSCPLTGHAIGRGVTKTSPPLDSLALTHQKRML